MFPYKDIMECKRTYVHMLLDQQWWVLSRMVSYYWYHITAKRCMSFHAYRQALKIFSMHMWKGCGGLTGLSGTVTCVGGGRNSHPFPDDEVHHCIQRKLQTHKQRSPSRRETVPFWTKQYILDYLQYFRTSRAFKPFFTVFIVLDIILSS